ncbi:MAG: hypothetical protein V7K41_26695 [Nostoc sp.]
MVLLRSISKNYSGGVLVDRDRHSNAIALFPLSRVVKEGYRQAAFIVWNRFARICDR